MGVEGGHRGIRHWGLLRGDEDNAHLVNHGEHKQNNDAIDGAITEACQGPWQNGRVHDGHVDHRGQPRRGRQVDAHHSSSKHSGC